MDSLKNSAYTTIDAPITIKDTLLVSQSAKEDVGIYGEFGNWRANEHTQLDRLYTDIASIIETEKTKHIQSHCDSNGQLKVENRNKINRLITSEFSFFTKEPLTLNAFQLLQNKIALLAQQAPDNLHFVLSSFAVKTHDDHVMNVVAYVECGEDPQVHFTVKNTPSSADPEYKIEKGNHLVPLPAASIINKPDLDLNVTILNKEVALSHHNIWECKTAGDAKFYSCIDICLDHYLGVGKKNIAQHIAQSKEIAEFNSTEGKPSNNTTLSPIQCSHIITSNTVGYKSSHSIGSRIVHADAEHPGKMGTHSFFTNNIPLFGDTGNYMETEAMMLDLLPADMIKLAHQQRDFILQKSDINSAKSSSIAHIELALIEINHDLKIPEKNVFAFKCLRDNISSLHNMKELEDLFNLITISDSLSYLRHPSLFEKTFSLITDRAQELAPGNELDSFLQAAELKKAEIINQFDPQRKDVNRRNEAGELPLEVALKKGTLAAIKKLLDEGADPNLMCSEKNSSGLSPLCVAMQYSDPTLISLLMKYGANVNKVSGENKMSPLAAAYIYTDEAKKYDIMELLAKGGADAALGGLDEQNLVQIRFALPEAPFKSFINSHADFPSDMWRNPPPPEPILLKAIEHDYPGIIHAFLRINKWPIDNNSSLYQNVLNYAVDKSNVPLIQAVLKKPEINLEQKNSSGHTPIQAAKTKEINQLLRDHKEKFKQEKTGGAPVIALYEREKNKQRPNETKLTSNKTEQSDSKRRKYKK